MKLFSFVKMITKKLQQRWAVMYLLETCVPIKKLFLQKTLK